MPSCKAVFERLGSVCLDRRQENRSKFKPVQVVRREIVSSSKYKPHTGKKQLAKAKKRRIAEWERGENGVPAETCAD